MKQDQPSSLVMSDPLFPEKTSVLVKKLQSLSQKHLTKTLEVSKSLGALNYVRYQSWQETPKRAALWMYSGDVYNGIDAYSMTSSQRDYAQQHLLIASGLYGLVRPFDAIQPYRLEMRLPFTADTAKNLYEYWQEVIQQELASRKPQHILLCASPEYADAIRQSLPDGTRVITPRFMQETDTGLREKGLFAKYARGALARWVINNKVQDPKQLQRYDSDGFVYSSDLSSETEIVFIVPNDFTLKGRFVKK